MIIRWIVIGLLIWFMAGFIALFFANAIMSIFHLFAYWRER